MQVPFDENSTIAQTSTMTLAMSTIAATTLRNDLDTPDDGVGTFDVYDILSILIGTVGLVTNGLVCIVVSVFLRSKRSRVNFLIFNQAVADLTISALLIGLTTSYYYLEDALADMRGLAGEFLCRVVHSRFLLFASFAISTHNLTAMSIERLVAVTYPVSYPRVYTPRNTIIIVICVWVVAPVAQYIQVIARFHVDDVTGECTDQPSWTSLKAGATGVFIFTWEYFLPCIIMVVSYVAIWRKLSKQAHVVGPTPSGPGSLNTTNKPSTKRRNNRARNVTITLFALFVVYLLCWTPNQFTFLAFNLGMPLDFDGAWYYFTVFAAFCNSCTNPLILTLKHQQFREGLKEILRCRCNRVLSTDDTGASVSRTVDQ